MVLEADHSTFGGSSASRWGNCPGSIMLNRQVGPTLGESPWAEEGTIAHSVAERILSGWEPPPHIDPDMVRYGRQWRDGILVYKDVYNAHSVKVEHKVISNRYRDVGGTVDASIDARRAKTIIIADYKYGAGEDVFAYENEQLKFYAAMELEELFPEDDGLFDGEVILSIFQPRSEVSGWKDWHTDGSRIYDYKLEMYERVEAVKQGDVTLSAGKWCRWCEAKAACPAYYEAFIEPLVPMTPIPQLKNATIHDLYKAAPQYSQYLKSLEGYIKNMCHAMGSFQTYTLARGRGATQWMNPINIESEFSREEYPAMYNSTLRTPKQILEAYPNLALDLEGQWTQTTYDKLITNEKLDYLDLLDDIEDY